MISQLASRSFLLLVFVVLSPSLVNAQEFFQAGTIWSDAQRGDLIHAQKLLTHQPELVNARQILHKGSRDEVDWTPLSLAAVAGQLQMTKFLLAHGANVHLRRSNGNTALYDVVIWGSSASPPSKIISLLISHGAKVNQRTKAGFIPLDYVSESQVAGLLLSKGANINDHDNVHRMTPLQILVKYRLTTESNPLKFKEYLAVIKLMINKRAALNASDKAGNRALDYARKIKQQAFRNQVVRLLTLHGAKER